MGLDPFWVTDPVGTMLKVGNSLPKFKKIVYPDTFKFYM